MRTFTECTFTECNVDCNEKLQTNSCFIQLHLNTLASCVDISTNHFTLWPKLHCPTSVEYLNLSHNFLTAFPDGVLYSRLRYLDLSHNNISYIDLKALQNMPNLEYLNLAHNPASYYGMLLMHQRLKVVITSKDRCIIFPFFFANV